MKVTILSILLFIFSNTYAQMPSVKPEDIYVSINTGKVTTDDFGHILVLVSIKNTSNKIQKILFDKTPKYYIGPWGTSIIIENDKNEITKPNTPNFYVSQIYTKEETEQCLTTLQPNESIIKSYEINKISRLTTLPKGNYKIQVNFQGILSNKVDLIIDKPFQ